MSSAAIKDAKSKVLDLLPKEMRTSVDLIDDESQIPAHCNSKHVLAGHIQDASVVIQHAFKQALPHICQVNDPNFATELHTAALMAKSPESIFRWPLATILTPAELNDTQNTKLRVLNEKFNTTLDKERILLSIRKTLEENGRPESLIGDVSLVADELFTNVVYNASVGAAKTTALNQPILRSHLTISMPKNHYGSLEMGFNDGRLLLVCRDNYGTLKPEQMLSRISSCYDQGVSSTIKFGAGGAGIGSFMIFNAASSLYIAVRPRQETVVAVTLHWKWSSRKRQEAAKNLHCLVFKGDTHG